MTTEIKQIPQLDTTEHSSSGKILDRVIQITQPHRYPLYKAYWNIVRGVDNLVDEGSSYSRANQILKEQRELTTQTNINVSSSSGESLLSILSQIPLPLQKSFLAHHLSLIDYFDIDLAHRLNLTPYTPQEMSRHIRGGFPELFANLRIILLDKDIPPNSKFNQLAFTHGQIEPLGDIDEDLERGLILHCRENAAPWIDVLEPGQPVPEEEIDQYVKNHRSALAKKLRKLSPTAIQGFGGLFGTLITLDYLKRSLYSVPNLKFQPKSPVIFASQRLGP